MSERLGSADTCEVNSRHHRSCEAGRPELPAFQPPRPTASSKRLKIPPRRFALAVQWHPENFLEDRRVPAVVRDVRRDSSDESKPQDLRCAMHRVCLLSCSLRACFHPRSCRSSAPNGAHSVRHSTRRSSKAWFAWKPAASPDGPCVSCHTGMTYLLARPALRRALGETQPTMFETGAARSAPRQRRCETGRRPSGCRNGFRRSLPGAAGCRKGRRLRDSPSVRSVVGTAARRRGDKGRLAVVSSQPGSVTSIPARTFSALRSRRFAIGTMPDGYAQTPEYASTFRRSSRSFETGADVQRPLHDRLARLWASSKLRSVLPDQSRKALIEETFGKQQADGGWSIESLRALDAASRRAALTRQQQLCHGFCDVPCSDGRAPRLRIPACRARWRG